MLFQVDQFPYKTWVDSNSHYRPQTKLGGKVIFLHLWVILFSDGGSAYRGSLHPGGSVSGGGLWADPSLRYGQQAGGMYPTGMHSCLTQNIRQTN